MKKTVSLICAFVLTLAFAGCNGSGTPSATSSNNNSTSVSTPVKDVKLRFSWWGSDPRHQATIKVIDLYKSKNPNVTIDAEYGGADGYQDKRMTEMASKTAPDIMQMDAPWLKDLKVKFNPFADLGSFSNVLDTSGFDADFMANYGKIDGVLYGLPTGINAMYMLMNTAVLDKALINTKQAWTWDSILNDGAKVHATDSSQYLLNLDQHSLEYHVLRTYIKQLTGEQIIKDDNTLGFTEENLTAGLSYIKQLFDKGVMQPASESFMYIDAFYNNPIWVNNKVGADLDWCSMLTPRKAGFSQTAAITVVPQMAGAKDSAVQIRPAQLLCISSASTNQEEAAKFVNFFFNDSESIGILQLQRSVPATTKAREQLAAAGLMDPLIKGAVDAALANAGKVENAMSANVQFDTILMDAVEKVGYGQATPEQAAKDAITQFLAKIKELKP